MKIKTLLGVLGFLLPILNANAQTIKPLTIGDTVPDITLRHILNYKDTTAKISDFRGRYLIFDFWATTCSSCLSNMPRMDSLQEKYKGQLTVLAVTYEPRAKIMPIFNGRKDKYGHPYHFTTLVGDTLLQKYFPHKTIPHMVWIDSHGRVAAITSGRELTTLNLETYLSGLRPAAPIKYDISTLRPLFLSDSFPRYVRMLTYSILWQGHYPGLPSGMEYRRQGDTIHGIAAYNTPLRWIFSVIAKPLFDDSSNVLTRKRVIVERRQASRHPEEEMYSLDFILPATHADSLRPLALQYLNSNTPFRATIEWRAITCYQLRPAAGTTATIVPAAKREKSGGDDLQYYPSRSICALLEQSPAVQYPVIPALDRQHLFDVRLSDISNMDTLRRELLATGLELVLTEAPVKVLVLHEK